MTSTIVIIVTIAVACLLRNPIKKAPMVFYGLSVAVIVLFFALSSLGAPRWVSLAFFWTIHKCLVPLALFILVMYIGVFSRTSKVSLWLRPIRAELSIIAWILTVGHVVAYLRSYLSPIFYGTALQTNVFIGIIVAIILFVLLIVLGVTSFRAIKKNMSLQGWKNVQRLAYPFFAFTYIHLLCLLLPSAMRGGAAATISVVVYSVIFIAYFVLRIMRAVSDRKAGITDTPAEHEEAAE